MMGLKADWKYDGTVEGGSRLITSQSGTIGYQVMLSCEDGETAFVIWLTAKNRKRAYRYFEALGVKPQQLRNRAYLDFQLGVDIQGCEIRFGTREDVYNNKKSIKVAWIGRHVDEEHLAQEAANFFKKADDVEETAPDIPNDDIPF